MKKKTKSNDTVKLSDILYVIKDSSIYDYLVGRLEQKITQNEQAIDGLECDLQFYTKTENKSWARKKIKEHKQQLKAKNKALSTLKQVIKQLEKTDV